MFDMKTMQYRTSPYSLNYHRGKNLITINYIYIYCETTKNTTLNLFWDIVDTYIWIITLCAHTLATYNHSCFKITTNVYQLIICFTTVRAFLEHNGIRQNWLGRRISSSYWKGWGWYVFLSLGNEISSHKCRKLTQ